MAVGCGAEMMVSTQNHHCGECSPDVLRVLQRIPTALLMAGQGTKIISDLNLIFIKMHSMWCLTRQQNNNNDQCRVSLRLWYAVSSSANLGPNACK